MIVLIDFARSNIFTSKEVCVLRFRFLFLSKLVSHIQKYTLNHNQPSPSPPYIYFLQFCGIFNHYEVLTFCTYFMWCTYFRTFMNNFRNDKR